MRKRTFSGQVSCQPCPGCGAKSYDPGRFHSLYRLCVYCFADLDIRAAAGDAWRVRQVERHRQADARPCEHLPGTESKVETLSRRASLGLALHHADDARPGQVRRISPRPVDDPTNEAICPGVDVDRTRKTVAYRARPCFRGIRLTLGQYGTHREAAAAIYAWWQSLCRNRPGRAGAWQRRRGESKVAAIVETWTGWIEIEFPPDCPHAIARRAGRKIMGRIWPNRAAAESAFALHLRSKRQ